MGSYKSSDVDKLWLKDIDIALLHYKQGDFTACHGALAQALNTIEAMPGQDDKWKLVRSLRAGDTFLNGIVATFYSAEAEEQIKYFDLLMLLAQKGRYSGMHQASFTLGRLFGMAADWYKYGYVDLSQKLVEVALAKYADSFGREDACLKLDAFGGMVEEKPAFAEALKLSLHSES